MYFVCGARSFFCGVSYIVLVVVMTSQASVENMFSVKQTKDTCLKYMSVF